MQIPAHMPIARRLQGWCGDAVDGVASAVADAAAAAAAADVKVCVFVFKYASFLNSNLYAHHQ